jgi:hypothetical protein
MPLPSVLNGAPRCQVKSKRSGERCKNPCAYGSKKACRVHGSHRSRNVPRGVNHPQYKNGAWTKEALEESRMARCRLAMLEQIGWYLQMFVGIKTRGKKPYGYQKFDLNDGTQLAQAVLKVLKPVN